MGRFSLGITLEYATIVTPLCAASVQLSPRDCGWPELLWVMCASHHGGLAVLENRHVGKAPAPRPGQFQLLHCMEHFVFMKTASLARLQNHHLRCIPLKTPIPSLPLEGASSLHKNQNHPFWTEPFSYSHRRDGVSQSSPLWALGPSQLDYSS